MNANALPLQGIRVVNFGWVWAGPVTGQTLSFLGAEVFKVESRARVDMTRNLPPFAEGKPSPDRSLSNHACWAGNGSVSLNLKEPEALQLVGGILGGALKSEDVRRQIALPQVVDAAQGGGLVVAGVEVGDQFGQAVIECAGHGQPSFGRSLPRRALSR